jgi:site-specific recombinase XerD
MKENPSQPSDPLFPSRRGGRLRRDSIERLVNKYIAKAHMAPRAAVIR